MQPRYEAFKTGLASPHLACVFALHPDDIRMRWDSWRSDRCFTPLPTSNFPLCTTLGPVHAISLAWEPLDGIEFWVADPPPPGSETHPRRASRPLRIRYTWVGWKRSSCIAGHRLPRPSSTYGCPRSALPGPSSSLSRACLHSVKHLRPVRRIHQNSMVRGTRTIQVTARDGSASSVPRHPRLERLLSFLLF